MFGVKALCEQVLSEVKSIRYRLDEVLGRTGDPPMSKRAFYSRIDEEVDTDDLKVDRIVTGAVLKTAFTALKRMPEKGRAAMVQELLR